MAAYATEMVATFARLTIREAMHVGVVTCRPDDDLATLAKTMVTHGIHATVIEGPGEAVPITVTDLELVRAALQRPQGVRAHEIARDRIAALPADAPLSQAVSKMAELNVAHVLAMDPASGAPCGMVSSFDIAAVLGGDRPGQALPFRPSVKLPPSAQSLSEARAEDVMHAGVVTCAPDAPVRVVAHSMAQHRVHCVAVAGVASGGPHAHHYSWGLVDDREVVRALHRNALAEPAASIAASVPAAITQDDSLAAAAALMVDNDTSHVVVVGPSGLPSGMISTLDVAWVLAASAE